MPPLSQYSEPVVDPMWFAVWCYVVAWLVIIIICIECPPRFVRFWTIWCNKCGISLLGLMFCITFKSSLMRGRFSDASSGCWGRGRAREIEREWGEILKSCIYTCAHNWAFGASGLGLIYWGSWVTMPASVNIFTEAVTLGWLPRLIYINRGRHFKGNRLS